MIYHGREFRTKIHDVLSSGSFYVGTKKAKVIYCKPERANPAQLPVIIVGDCSLKDIKKETPTTQFETYSIPVAVHAQGARDSSNAVADTFQDVFDCVYTVIRKLMTYLWNYHGTYGGESSITIHEDEMEGSQVLSMFTITMTILTDDAE